jgi:hypothetical protein
MLAAGSEIGDILVWGLALIGGVCVLSASVWAFRRWLFSTPGSTEDDGWSLQGLREMRAKGQITEPEFQALKTKLLKRSGYSATGEEGAG